MIFLKTDLHWLSGRAFTRLLRANPMRGHWKAGGGFPPPLFLLETGVSLLCPVSCSEIFYQEEPQLEQELAAVKGNP